METVDYPSPISYPSPVSVEPSEIMSDSLSKKRAVSPDEALTKKRQRQNEAAKRCRQKKMDLLNEAQEQARKFEQEKFEMSVRLAVLEKEKQAWLLREKEMQHELNRLKQQLDESHLILMNVKKH
jgi:hypothetical protein